MKNATIGAAVLGGYLLGRTKKAKLALGAGALLAGSKARPGQLAKMLDSPFLSNVTQQVRTELTDASKAAATSMLTAKADSLAGALHERTEVLRERAHPDDERNGPDDQQDEPDARDEENGGQDEEDGGQDRSEAKQSRGGSQRRGPSRGKRQSASASRGKSGDTSKSRRQDDG